jgi:acyl dehydratase
MGLNYGSDKVRYPAPVPVDSRVRLGATLSSVDERDDGSVQVRWTYEVQVEGGGKPGCVAELVFRYSF